jgi:hypothetical protein
MKNHYKKKRAAVLLVALAFFHSLYKKRERKELYEP